jgi:hypothetical protein
LKSLNELPELEDPRRIADIVQDLNLDLDWEEDERREDAMDDKTASTYPLETGEFPIDVEDSADHEPLQTPHTDVEVAAIPPPDVQTAEDDMPKVAAPTGE